MTDHRTIFEKCGRALNDANLDLLSEVLADDYTEEYQQSGEVVRGRDNLIAIIWSYPGRMSEMSLGDSSTLKVNRRTYEAVAPKATQRQFVIAAFCRR